MVRCSADGVAAMLFHIFRPEPNAHAHSDHLAQCSLGGSVASKKEATEIKTTKRNEMNLKLMRIEWLHTGSLSNYKIRQKLQLNKQKWTLV